MRNPRFWTISLYSIFEWYFLNVFVVECVFDRNRFAKFYLWVNLFLSSRGLYFKIIQYSGSSEEHAKNPTSICQNYQNCFHNFLVIAQCREIRHALYPCVKSDRSLWRLSLLSLPSSLSLLYHFTFLDLSPLRQSNCSLGYIEWSRIRAGGDPLCVCIKCVTLRLALLYCCTFQQSSRCFDFYDATNTNPSRWLW